MFSVIWSGASTGSDILLLIAAVLAALAAIIPIANDTPALSLLPAAVALLALGLLAI